ncbi:MAG: beta-hydroxyacyl-ACP dehydratase [Gemmataceae bacterium]|nr:beta-hydroxyacyl-ACP dehydratase [Gemmataceae bacterium]
MRWIWIDRFLAYEKGKSATTAKYLSLAEDFLTAHFPGYPVMPAPLILEGMAQTGGILVGDATDFREKVVLAKINKATFTGEAVAGQELVYKVELISLRSEGSIITGEVSADGISIGQAEIQFAHLDNTRAGQMFGETNFVFTGELKRMLAQAHSTAKP